MELTLVDVEDILSVFKTNSDLYVRGFSNNF